MAAAAILKFTLMASTWSLFNMFAQNLAQRLRKTSRNQFYLQISHVRKSKMSAAAILKIGLKVIYISAYICMEFCTLTKTVSHSRFCCKNSLSAKSMMAAAAVLKFTLMALITRSLLRIFAQKLAQRLKAMSQKQVYLWFSLLGNPTWRQALF